MTQDFLNLYASILQSAHAASRLAGELSEDERLELLCKGVVVTLEGQGSERAIEILYATALAHPIQGVLALAQLSLERLADSGSGPAMDSLYRLAVETGRLALAQRIKTRPWQPTRATLRALFHYFHGDAPIPESALELLARAYFEEASPALRERILYEANEKGLTHWALIVAAENDLRRGARTQAKLDHLVEIYPSLREPERCLAINRLAHLAEAGPEAARDNARAALARLFVDHEDPRARQIALERGYAPEDPEKRALFFFLAESWREYESLDENHALLVSSFEYGSKGLRRRLLEHARRAGYMEWLRSPSSSGLKAAGEVRWPAELSDADWDLAVRRLGENQRWPELWQLAQAAPPVWSAQMIGRLAHQGWQPPEPDERPSFAALSSLARECLAAILTIRPQQSAVAPAALHCLALRPDGAQLAAGSADQRIFCWNLPDLELRQPALAAPAPVARALAFSPDGSLLAAAAGDHRIRVFRQPEGVLVKTLEGHRAMIRALVVHPDGRLLASAGFDGSIRLWRFPFGPELKNLRPSPDQNEIFSLAIGADRRSLLSAGTGGVINVWAAHDGAPLRAIQAHAGAITSLAPSQESDLVVSAGRDDTLRVWNFNSGRMVKAIEHPGGAITALCLHPNDQVIIGASAGRGPEAKFEIMLWNLSTGLLIERLAGHTQAITGLAVTRSGETLYSCDAAGRLLAWDLRAFLTIRLAGRAEISTSAGELPQNRSLHPTIFRVEGLQSRLNEPGVTPAEKKWLVFTLELARFRQRYDIELAEVPKIPLGEFDIEL